MRLHRRSATLLIAGVTCVAATAVVLLVLRPSVAARSALATARSELEQEYAAALNPGDLFPLESVASAMDGSAIRLRDLQTCCIVVAPGCATCLEYAGVAEGLGKEYPGIQFVLLMVGTDGQGVVAGPHMRLAVDQNRAAVAKLSDHDARAPAVFLIRADGTIAWKSVGIKLQLVWTGLNEALHKLSATQSGALPGSEVTPKVGEKLAPAICDGASVSPVSADRFTVLLVSHSTYLSADAMKLQADFLARLAGFADPVLVASVYDEVRWRAACDYAVLYSTASVQTATQNLRLLPSINRGEVTKVEDYVQHKHSGVAIAADPCWSFVLTYGQSSYTSLMVIAPDRTVKAVIPYSLQGSSADGTLTKYIRSIIEH
ncbi:MAG: hypothetical protein ABFC79_05020 [Candidatus Cryosericum sp.]|nr:hypothetical protein [Candidatus Cryosericum sp.]